MQLALDTPSDQVILGALRAGDTRRAASLLVECFGQRAYQLCRLAAVDTASADDLTVRGFSRALARLTELRGEQTPGEWLLGHVWQTCAAALLPPPGEPCSEPLLGSATGLHLASRGQRGPEPELEAVRRAFAEAEPTDRAALALVCSATFPSCSLDAQTRQRARDLLERLCSGLARDGQLASSPAICRRLAELRWPLSAELQRRLAMLCSAL